MMFLKDYPNFICVGVQKSGTTWLYKQLIQHPQIKIPIKEILFFNQDDNKPIKQYRKFFYNYENYFCGEMTPEYFKSKRISQILKENFPKTKIFVILRNPTDRAFSQYRMGVHVKAWNNLSFLKAFHNNMRDISYRGLYDIQLENYLEYYNLNENLKVFFYDDMIKNPESFYKDVCLYLNIDEFVPKTINDWEITKYNSDGLKISDKEKVIIDEYYKKSINNLEFILNKKTNWKI